ncbi:MAG: dockerin type I domain-containing protein, partial [Candidatus Zixiibacteriota bacterium]
MELKISFSMATLVLVLAVSGVSWAQCPEAPVDLGECDTLNVICWDCAIDTSVAGPYFVRVLLLVTHDSNYLEYPPGNPNQDSIAGFVIPLTWTHTNPSVYCSVSSYWNTADLLGPPAERSVFRHLIDEETGDTIMINRMMWMQWQWQGWEWDTRQIELSTDPPYIRMALLPTNIQDRRWWEGERTLLATITFKVADTMHVSLDSTFWPPGSRLEFTRYDAVNYIPRHSMPLTMWFGPSRIVVTSPNGGESWVVGETQDITWLSENFTGANVKLEFSTDAGVNWMTIIESTPNDGAYPWVIPDTTSDSCRVKVSDTEDGDPYDISDSNFSITYESDFTIEAIPDTQWVKQGDSTSFEVILTALYGFNSPCTLTVTGLPSLATGEFNPAVIVPTDTSTLTIGTDTLTPLGIYPITITATEMVKQVEHSVQKWLIVVSALNFKPAISVPESVVVYAGFTANFTVVATDPDTVDTLSITKDGVGEFPCPPRTTPNVCYFWWSTEEADTLNSPYEVIFTVDDGRDSTDTGIVWIHVLYYNIPPSGTEGDATGDGIVDIADVVFLINYLFGLGPPPNPPSAGDVNGDCFIGVSDIVWLINYLFKEGPPPQIRCLPGDVNYDGNVNLLDVFYFIDYVFFNGSSPVSMRSTDVNADCFINAVDLVYLINYLLRGGSPPQPGCVEPKPGGPETAPTSAIAEVGFSNLRYDQKSRIMELPVNADFDVPVAGVALSITWDPEELSFLEPVLTPRSEGLGLYY